VLWPPGAPLHSGCCSTAIHGACGGGHCAQGGRYCLVTGENLGQVASQTLENILAIDRVATMPVLRPLIGLDKIEIIDQAKRIGTFTISIEPHGDCCSFLMPPNPATHSTDEELSADEKCFEVEAEVSRLVESSEVVRVQAWGALPDADVSPEEGTPGKAGSTVGPVSGDG